MGRLPHLRTGGAPADHQSDIRTQWTLEGVVRMDSSSGDGPAPTRAEVLAALSLSIDLGLGQPMEHMLRAAVIATRLADRAGLDADQRAVVYYADLIAWIGCHADSPELAAVFRDDIGFRAGTYHVDMTGLPGARF